MEVKIAMVRIAPAVRFIIWLTKFSSAAQFAVADLTEAAADLFDRLKDRSLRNRKYYRSTGVRESQPWKATRPEIRDNASSAEFARWLWATRLR